jgi:hypothetical protein
MIEVHVDLLSQIRCMCYKKDKNVIFSIGSIRSIIPSDLLL